MSDYQSIVENIRTILCSDVEPDFDAVASLDADYVAAIEEVNDRLKSCDALLHKGHRSEALQMCDIEPRLMDVVGTLDFAEREQWAEYLRQIGLPAPPELLIEVAAEINEAYAAEAPLAGLMRLHRLYGLGRVALPLRIEVLRKIAAADPENPIWDEDIRTFEKARHDQLRDEATLAVKNNDLRKVAALEREVSDAGWRVPPPRGTVDRVLQAHTRMRAEQARLEITDVEAELTAAYSSLSPDIARPLRTRWNKLLTIADLPPDDPMLDLVAPALDWLANEDRLEDEQQRHAAAIAALTTALDDNQPQLELERLYRAAAQLGREVPHVLEQRLSERLRYLADRDVRRFRLQVVGMVSAVLILGGLTATAIVHQLRSREQTAYVTNLEQLLAGEELAEAEKYLEGMQQTAPRVYQSPQVQKLNGDLQALLTRESERRGQFQQALAAARAAGVEGASWETFPTARDDLKRAGELAKTGGERTEIKVVERQVREQQTTLQNDVDAAFLKQLDSLKEQIATLADDDLAQNTRLQQAGVALQQLPRVTPEIKAQIEPLLAKLRTTEVAQLGGQREASALQQVTRTAGNLGAYRGALEGYVAAFPGTKRAADFERVLKNELDVWKGVEAWDELARRWSTIDFSRVDPKAVPPLLAEARQVLDKYADHPSAVDLEGILEYVRAIARRVDQNGALIAAKLNEPLNNPTIAGLFMVQTNDGKRYYNDEPPQLSADGWSVRFVKGFDLVKKGQKLVSQSEIANPKTATRVDWHAPQSTFSQTALPLLDKLNNDNWDTTFIALLDNLYSQQTMEPLLKLQLMSLILEVARQGSLPLDKAFAKHVDLIASSQIDPAINWLNPDDAEANKTRLRADGLLKRMPRPRDAAAVVTQMNADLKKPLLRPGRQAVAWLHRDREGQWVGTGSTRDRGWEKSSGTISMIDVPADGSPASFVTLGTLKEGKFLLNLAPPPPQPAPQGLVEGRLLFLVPAK